MYFKPERIKGEDYSVHSEVWSLGVSLFEVSSKCFNLLYCSLLICKKLHPYIWLNVKVHVILLIVSCKPWHKIDSFCPKRKRSHYQKGISICFSLRWANFPMNQ